MLQCMSRAARPIRMQLSVGKLWRKPAAESHLASVKHRTCSNFSCLGYPSCDCGGVGRKCAGAAEVGLGTHISKNLLDRTVGACTEGVRSARDSNWTD